MHPGEHDPRPTDWARELRRHHEGVLVAEHRAVPLRFIIDPATGQVVMPVEGWLVEVPSAVLFLPEERDDALQALLEQLTGAQPSGAAQDRWCAYHGEPRHRHWACARVTGMRREGNVCDDVETGLVNTLGAAESRLVRSLNARRDALAAACEAVCGVRVSDPCAVGVDPRGIDVRARFGIVRMEFPVDDAAQGGGGADEGAVEEMIRRLLDGAAGRGA